MDQYFSIGVTSRSFSQHAQLREELLARFPNSRIIFNDTGQTLSGQALIDFLRSSHRAIISLERIDATVLDAAPNLKVVSKYGVGLDSLDLCAMQDRGIKLGWTPGVNRRAVAELVICFAISLLRNFSRAQTVVIDGEWHQMKGRELSGRVVGVIGCGHIGKDVAKLARAFGCQVLAHDIVEYSKFYKCYDITPVALDELLLQSDIVTLHTPLNGSTENILSAEKLALMTPGSILINAARGGLVDESALKIALSSQALAGAGFDVFAIEPPIDKSLLSLPNFLATPHIGGSTDEAILSMGRAAIEGLLSHGDPLTVASNLAPDRS